MPEINRKQWTKEEVHTALKDGRVEDVWPGATFVDHGDYGDLTFADGSQAGIRFDPQPKRAAKKGARK